MQTPEWRPVDFDGLVVEDDRGNRLLALPTAVLEILRHAAVIRFRRADSMFSMRLDAFTDGRTGGQPIPQQPNTPRPAPTSAPTPEYGAPALPVHGARNPSPAPPPPVQEGDPLDPANIPLRVRRGESWATVYVTREQYERYEREGKLTHQPTDEGTQQ